MNIPHQWLYPTSLEEAQNIQRELAQQLIFDDHFSLSQRIGGVDVSNNLYDSMIYASAVVLNKQTLKLEEEKFVSEVQHFPYIPGFLGFREAPALVKAFKHLDKKPDILLVDGHGISHPRQLGIASHLGVLLNIPTIGVAKSILVGKPRDDLGEEKGDQTALIWKGKQIGILLRTKRRCLPLIISCGHRVSLTSAIEIVMNCLTTYRLPEPTRQAHLAANRCRKAAMASQ